MKIGSNNAIVNFVQQQQQKQMKNSLDIDKINVFYCSNKIKIIKIVYIWT